MMKKEKGEMATVWHSNHHQSQGEVVKVHADGQVTLSIKSMITGKPVKGFPL